MNPASSFSSPSSCNLSCKNGRTTAACISRILRRILCFSSLPLCSFDHFKDDAKESSVLIGASGTTPGLVARLMGLDSIPRIEPVEESPLMSSDDSFKKSRSSKQVRRRRIIPAYQELEDENFFILSFEKRRSRRESHVETWKSGKNSLTMEQSVRDKRKKKSMRKRESLQGKNQENEEANMDSKENFRDDNFQVENPGNDLCPFKNACQEPEKSRTKRANGDNIVAAAISLETEGGSENSSPNSVLEFVESAFSGEISRLANFKMRRPLSDELENCGNSSEKKLINNGDDDEEKEKINSRLRNTYQNYGEKWDEIGKLAAMEMIKSRWFQSEISKNQHCLMEIGRDLESDILDQLLDELLINLENF